jgi:hypothetical protein
MVSVVFNGADAPSFHTESTRATLAHHTKCSNSSAVKTLLRRCFDASQVCVFHDSFKAKGALLRASALVISLAMSLVKIESI